MAGQVVRVPGTCTGILLTAIQLRGLEVKPSVWVGGINPHCGSPLIYVKKITNLKAFCSPPFDK